MTTYHVQHRYGFVGDYDDVNKIVIDCKDAVIYSRIGAIRAADEINKTVGEFDRKAHPVMLTMTGPSDALTFRVRRVHGIA